MTFTDGSPVPEFWFRLHRGGTAGRWSDEPFDLTED
jgi:hypothetical protein